MGIPLVFIIIGCVVVLGLGYLGFNFISNSALNLTQANATNGAHVTLNAFCTAISHNDYSTAYSYLTPAFQARIGSPQDVATKLTTAFGGQQVTITGCQPFSSGIDGFYRENGDAASNEVQFSALTATGASTTVSNQTMKFIKDGSTWKIDSVQSDV